MSDYHEANNLRGQVGIITGGGRGLGREMAQALAAAGMAVAIVARTADQVTETVKLIEQAGGRALTFLMDVTDRLAVQEMVITVEQQLGPVNLLINNAALVSPLGPVWSADPDEWWQTMNVNLRGPLLCSHYVLPKMIERRQGRIINVSSGAGVETVPNWSAYITSKAALMRLSELMAAETKPHGISVLCIDPGPVLTAMTEYMMQSEEGRQWVPQFRQIFDEGRNVPPDRVVDLVLLIASGQADALSGCYFSVTDDVRALIKQAALIAQNDLHRLRIRA